VTVVSLNYANLDRSDIGWPSMKYSFFAATRVRFQRRLSALAAMRFEDSSKAARARLLWSAWQRPSATVTWHVRLIRGASACLQWLYVR
jgi:hypothetical protein